MFNISDTLRYLAKNFFWLMLENLVKIVVGFTVSVYVIRYLGPQDFGLISYSLSIIGVLYPFSSLGIDAILFRNLIKDKENEATLIYTAKILKLMGSMVLVSASILVVYLYGSHNEFMYIFILLSLGLIIDVFSLYKEYFLSIEKTKFITISSVFSLFFSSMLNILFVIFKLHVIWFAFVYLVQKMFNIVSLKYFYKQYSISKKSTFDKSLAREMLADSWPLIFASFAGLLYMSVDQILIKYFFDFKQVGLYATAVKLIMIFYVIPSILSNILYPKIIKMHKKLIKIDFIKQVEKIYFFNLLIAVIVLLFFIFFGKYIILFLFGEEFKSSIGVLLIYSVGLIFVFFGSLNNKLLMMDNLQKLMLGRNILGLFVNVILNLILIPKYGISGAAMATVLTEFFIVLSYGLNEQTRYILYIQLKSFVYPFIILKEKYL